jgi:serpin B
MKARFTTAIAISSFLSLLGQLSVGETQEPQTTAPVIAQAGNQFAVDLYGQLNKAQPGKNLFFSPASLSIALAMTAAGATGETEAEMAAVLHLGEGWPQAHAEYQKLLKRWNGEEKDRGYQLHVANRLWGQKGFPFLASYLDLTRERYAAELGIVDFADQPEAARAAINTWVEKQTAEKIKDLIPRGQLDAQTKMVLTNAVYFKGDWVSAFPASQTHDADFTAAAGQKVTVPLMHQEARYSYAEDASLQILAIPYKGDELSMFVLLPRAPDGLPELERSLSAAKVAALRAELRGQKVDVYLPKFKLEASFSLGDALRALGMKLAFSDTKADFSAMDGRRDLYISAALHKAYVDVNEQGTEAAAATAIGMRAMAARMPKPIPVFRADHPFVFLIADNRDGSMLFLGRMQDPKAAAN